MNNEGVFDINSPFDLGVFMKRLFTSGDFMPHGHCYFWRADVLWLNVFSDAIIALAYYSIPIILIYFVLRRKDIPFNWLFLMFGAFIFLCGTTHVVNILTVWIPAYRMEGVVKLTTALVSIATAVSMVPLIPRILSFPSVEMANKMLSQKTLELQNVNQDLERFNRAATGREQRIIELKKEVNKLAQELGKKQPYEMV